MQLGDGPRCYLAGPPAPYGALAELVPVPDSAGLPVPAGVDPGLAAALGVTGIVGWVALDYRAHLQAGETVLVLGAGGSAGQMRQDHQDLLRNDTWSNTLTVKLYPCEKEGADACSPPMIARDRARTAPEGQFLC